MKNQRAYVSSGSRYATSVGEHGRRGSHPPGVAGPVAGRAIARVDPRLRQALARRVGEAGAVEDSRAPSWSRRSVGRGPGVVSRHDDGPAAGRLRGVWREPLAATDRGNVDSR